VKVITKYSDYIDSKAILFGHVPKHWKFQQLKRTIKNFTNGMWGNEPEENEHDIIVIRVADFNRNKLNLKESSLTHRNFKNQSLQSRLLKKGDLLLEKSGGGEKTLVGQVVIFDKPFKAITSNFVAKMTPCKEYSSVFLNYLFQFFYTSKINVCSIKQNTGIQNLDSNAYLCEKFYSPPIIEQTQIANFLDYETAKIDKLIKKQERLIKLLKEKRQAVISQAVTKGLNPDVKMKDSSVEWLGQIPEHWEVKPLKFLAKIKNGKDYKKVEADTGYPVIGSGGQFTLAKLYLYNSESVLLGRKGTIDKPRYIDKPFWTVDTMFYTEVNSSIPVKYFYYLCKTILFDKYSTSTALPSMTQEDLSNILFAIPNVEAEMKDIFHHLDYKLAKIKEIIYKTNQMKDLLLSKRASLITATVTGKIDVRDWQPPIEKNTINKEIVNVVNTELQESSI